ncbi:smr domain-containing protein [Decorospora gaudefroyi]|uniref:Smr domain-containing protein n=1 Tax=Decorospora gaudefroyi TaxID=184978 RepID=A0A6A5JWU3_9PLEO|nr:smr domain-containing protein [Decorospora gaudefroyi]
MVEDVRMLEQEYSPPIDPALIYSIYADFEGQPNQIGLARELLDVINISAEDEASSGFDPSGSSGDFSSLSNDVSVLSVSERSGSSADSYEDGYYKETEQFDVATKELLLAETFPSLKLWQVSNTLRKCGNDFNRATDELLNRVFFDDAGTSSTDESPIAKGIDAFSEDHHIPQRGKKGKAKAKRKQKVPLNAPGTDYFVESDAPTNHWQNTSRDVDFVTSRTSLSAKTVSSLYHANGASLSTTVLAIVRKDVEAHRKDAIPDAALLQDALTLNEDFPSMDLEYALALVRLAAPSMSNAQALAKCLTQQPPSETGSKGGLKLNLRYTPVNLSDSSTEAPMLPTLAPSARPRNVASTTQARNEAFNKASSSYRIGKSTPLMKQAAAYYAQEGRDLNANLKAMNAAEADALVSSQSNATSLDLHGVTVADATRIAKQRTQAWWNGLGERRIPEWSGPGRRGGGEAYRIITGLGRHSVGGRSKIGPAVLKALVNEGWKVEAEPGELYVTGLARRR